MVVGGRAGGLHEIHILAADILFDFDECFAIGERTEGALADRNADVICDRFGERAIRRAAKNFHRRSILSLREKNAASFGGARDCSERAPWRKRNLRETRAPEVRNIYSTCPKTKIPNPSGVASWIYEMCEDVGDASCR